MNNQLVIIFGHSPASNVGLARALGSLGIEIVIVCDYKYRHRIHPESHSKYVSEYHFLNPIESTQSITFLKSKYGARCPKAILIATSDVAANFFDTYHDILAETFLVPNLDHRICDSQQLMDKYFQKQLAQEAGFNVLKAWTVDLREPTYTIPDEITYPCFTKGVMSINTPKRFLHRCNNFEELSLHLSEIKAYRPSKIMVEQYAKIDKEWGIMAFCNGQDVYMPMLTEFKVLGKGPIPGVSILGTSKPFDTQSDLYKTAHKFLQSLNMVGLCNIDLFEMNGKFYFSELNIRYAAYCYSIFSAGINLPHMYIQALQGEKINNITTPLTSISYYSEYIALSDIDAGKITRQEAKLLEQQADVNILYNQKDSAPYIYYMFNFYVTQKFKKVLRPIKHKMVFYLHSLFTKNE